MDIATGDPIDINCIKTETNPDYEIEAEVKDYLDYIGVKNRKECLLTDLITRKRKMMAMFAYYREKTYNSLLKRIAFSTPIVQSGTKFNNPPNNIAMDQYINYLMFSRQMDRKEQQSTALQQEEGGCKQEEHDCICDNELKNQ
jgi:hypothetical protein